MTKTNLRIFYHYWQILKNYKLRLFWSIVTVVLVIVIRTIYIPLVFAKLIDQVSSGLSDQELFAKLIPEALTFLVVYIIGIAVDKLNIWLIWSMEIRADNQLGTKIFNHLSIQSMSFYSDRFSGSLVSQTTRFVSVLSSLLDIFFWQIILLFVSLISISIVLWPRAPLFVLVMLVSTILYTVFVYFTQKKITNLYQSESAAYNKLSGQLSDTVSNISSVKAYANETYESRRYSKFYHKVSLASTKLMNTFIIRSLGFEFFNLIIYGSLIFFLIFGPNWFGLTISSLILIANFSHQLIHHLDRIRRTFRDVGGLIGRAQEMADILDLPVPVVDCSSAQDLIVEAGNIEFKNVTFQHHDGESPVFENFNLKIAPGERIGVVGTSGSGKSTLAKILLRFADLDSGQILIDNQNISLVTQKSLRQNIAYVPQETALFNRSIFDNIAYAKPSASRQEIINSARLANADQFISNLPKSYQTMVGERGVKLSGGQRQRLAIARAILKNAPILILDEATSALDSESEALIQEALKELLKDRTALVIAHRLSTVASLDRIIVLENGKIIEQGSHQELLKRSGTYAKLWSRQSTFLD